MGGFNFDLTQEFNLKISGLHRIIENEISVTDVGVRGRYDNMIRLAANYRINHAAGLILGMQVTPNIDVAYSYEIPTGSFSLPRRGSHELPIIFDFTDNLIPKRKRRFLKKRSREEEEAETMNSIRYF
ncbi:MAG: type IX secretion system membrane protein PorP/SprF [Marinilabilia sp.]